MAARLRRELKEGKDQAVTQRLRYTDWNKELQDRIAVLRDEKKAWMSEAATMRAAEKEAKVSVGQRIELLWLMWIEWWLGYVRCAGEAPC